MVRVALALLVVATSATADALERGAWSPLPAYPTAISNNAVTSVCDGGGCTIYSFMGIVDPDDTSTITADSYALLPGAGAWTAIASAPRLGGLAKIAANAVTCNGGEVYLLGGYTVGAPSEVTEKRLFVYDPMTDAYLARADVPVEVDDTVAGCYQDRYIYLVSGWHGPINNNVTDAQVYDTQTDSWRSATPLPAPGRFGHAGGVTGDRIVIIDGAKVVGFSFVIEHSTLVGTIDPSDPTVIAWASATSIPGAPTYRAAAATSEVPCARIAFAGGTDNPYNIDGIGYDGNPSSPLDQVMLYDPVADLWESVDDSLGDPHTSTMDHRGLVRHDAGWTTVGGMTAPRMGSAAVSALELLDLTAPSVGNTLRGRRDGRDVELSWDDALPLVESWNIYRRDRKEAPAGAPTVSLTMPYVDPLAADPTPEPYFYAVRTVICDGMEGPE